MNIVYWIALSEWTWLLGGHIERTVKCEIYDNNELYKYDRLYCWLTVIIPNDIAKVREIFLEVGMD